METFHISQTHLRRLALNFWLSLGIVAAVILWQILRGGLAQTSGLVLGAAILATAGLYFGRTRKRQIERALAHSLVLSTDAMLLRDGQTELRIPYASIEAMNVRKALLGSRWFSLRVAGQGSDSYYGYENMDQLIETLAAKIGTERVSGKRIGA